MTMATQGGISYGSLRSMEWTEYETVLRALKKINDKAGTNAGE